MTEKPFEEARDLADRLAAAGWGSPVLDQLRQKLHELAPKDPAMTLSLKERQRRAKVEAKAITEDLRQRHPEFAPDLTYANTSSAKARIEALEADNEALRRKLDRALTRSMEILYVVNDTFQGEIETHENSDIGTALATVYARILKALGGID
jgi:hypothetical protein